MREYAAVCGSTNDEYAAVCGSTNDVYAAVCGIAVKTMRQYADRAVMHTLHPAIFAVCFQRDGLKLPVFRYG